MRDVGRKGKDGNDGGVSYGQYLIFSATSEN